MNTFDLHLPDNHQEILDHFVKACKADERILAAFLGGSYANDKTDPYSDLDLFFITSDQAYEEFLATREGFIHQLGQPLFLEDWGLPHVYVVIFSNGTEADICFYRESNYKEADAGSYRVLLDKKGVLAGVNFLQQVAEPARQTEKLRQQLDWFWHDLSHFIKAMGRRQLWFAHGELEIIRQVCINLARLKYNFLDPYVGEEPYFKLDQILPCEQLKPLAKTIGPLEYGSMLASAWVIFRFYQSVAPSLAKQHGITYQVGLEALMHKRLEELG